MCGFLAYIHYLLHIYKSGRFDWRIDAKRIICVSTSSCRLFIIWSLSKSTFGRSVQLTSSHIQVESTTLLLEGGIWVTTDDHFVDLSLGEPAQIPVHQLSLVIGFETDWCTHCLLGRLNWRIAIYWNFDSSSCTKGNTSVG